MDEETRARPDPSSAPALKREIEVALSRIEEGMAQASAGIASLRGPISVMADLIVAAGDGEAAGERVGSMNAAPQAEESDVDKEREQVVPIVRFHARQAADRRSAQVVQGDQKSGEQLPPEVPEAIPDEQDQLQSKVFGKIDAGALLAKVEERLRNLGGSDSS